MTSGSRSFRFARNVSWSILGQAAAAAANFFLIPVILGRLGLDGYGLYVLLNAVAGYLTLLSMGGGTGVIKWVAQFWAERDGKGLGRVLRFGGAAYVGGALAGIILTAWKGEFLVTWLFRVPPALADQGLFAVRCAALGALPVGLTILSTSVLAGLQRFDLLNLIGILQNALMPLGAAAAASLGYGITGIGAWYVACNVGVCAAAVAIVWRLLQPAREFHNGKGLSYREFAAYSLGAAPGPIAWIVTFQLDKVFIARTGSLADLTLYSVPAGLLQRLHVMAGIVNVVLVPMMAELKGPQAADDLARIYLKGTRFLLWCLLPVLTLLFILMPQFLGLWLGAEFGGKSVWPARFLVGANLFFLLNYLPGAVVFSKDRPHVASAVAWCQAVLSLACWAVLVPRLGLFGAGLGALIGQAVPACAYLAWVHSKVLGLSLGRYLAHGLAAPGASAVLVLVALLPFHASATSWLRLCAFIAAGLALFYGSTWFLLVGEDRDLLKRYLRWEPRAAGGV
jgi:O-antigen/teichoic acid export membrane protein